MATSEQLRRLDELKGSFAGRRVGVLGLGLAGGAMAQYLAARGAKLVVADKRTDVEREGLAGADVEWRLGEPSARAFDGVEGLAISPGADPRQPAVMAVLAKGLPVFGELELGHPLPATVAAVTGTNGKSTTTALLGALVQATGKPTFVGGNLGDPICAWLNRGERVDYAVLELSSYQLESAYRFAPRSAVVLNVTPDHAERYPDLEAYAAAKQRIVLGLGPADVAVLNADDPRVSAMAASTRGRVLWFSTRGAALPGAGAVLEGDRVSARGECAVLDGLDLTHGRLFGRHNRENALAAWLALYGLGVVTPATRPAFEQAYRDFRGLEHRLELVAEVAGVRYVNDSKATNDDAAAIGVGAMDRPTVLLAGGVDKGGGYARLVEAARGRVRAVVCYGAARELIAAAFAGEVELHVESGMQAAFARAVSLSRPGDAVLLSPACSSFDEFKNYAHRGRTFKEYVAALGQGERA